MQVNKSVGILLAAAGSLGHVTASQAEDLAIRPLPVAASQPAPANTLALAVPVAAPQPAPTSALAVPVAATANPKAAALPIQQVWSLVAGDTIGQNLRAWADLVGWTVMWTLPKDWVVPGTASFTGSFADAAESVIKTLAENGALVRAQIYEGNKTIVISGPGVAQQ
ncbi:toxin co-regulated pilus biosynthesis Q family protein [Cupriavidus necator]|uniref:toxin co-regulated pilus biosynthesis Q family protein n=1 Tax=Cupriavidus necator TaxID=106590 RepID=UPI003ECE4818